jgi:5-hydroxyisourate hydrolase
MGISSHVLDTTLGRPATGIKLQLQLQNSGEWDLIGTGETDADGRCKALLPPGAILETGVYRIRFETGAYIARVHGEGLYPFIELTFTVRDAFAHYHIPLLLSPNGYTTYRGS